MKLTSMQRSVLAIIGCILFLMVGKMFIWNTPQTTQQSGNPADSVAEVTETTAAVTETTTTTEETTTSETTSTTTAVSTENTKDKTEETTGTGTTMLKLTSEKTSSSESETTTTTTTAGGLTAAPIGYFSDALFIGDSRTVGQAEFGPIDGATYFASVGLSTYKIDESASEVSATKGMNFTAALGQRQYTKIYIMLGINELGYDRNQTQINFVNLLNRIQREQPDAIIYIEANLHVAKSRSETDDIVNNKQIDDYNKWLSRLADDDKIYYLDANPLFDDNEGNLSEVNTGDGTHPYAKLYLKWAEWLENNVIIK